MCPGGAGTCEVAASARGADRPAAGTAGPAEPRTARRDARASEFVLVSSFLPVSRGESKAGTQQRTAVHSAEPRPVQTTLANFIAILQVWVCFVFINVLMTSPSPRVLGEIRRLWTFAFEHPGVKHQEKVTRAGRPPDTAAPASASAITNTFPAAGN